MRATAVALAVSAAAAAAAAPRQLPPAPTPVGRASTYGWMDGVGMQSQFSTAGIPGYSSATGTLFVPDTDNHVVSRAPRSTAPAPRRPLQAPWPWR